MRKLEQFIALFMLGLGSLRQRPGAVAVIVVGTTCVVAALVSLLSMGAGLRTAAMVNVSNQRAVVLSKGAYSAFRSDLNLQAVNAILDMPGISRNADGALLATATHIVLAAAHRKDNNAFVSFPLLGIDQRYLDVFTHMRLTAGRMFTPGLNELIVGEDCQERFKGLGLGERIRHGRARLSRGFWYSARVIASFTRGERGYVPRA